jgi:hypothetical protein
MLPAEDSRRLLYYTLASAPWTLLQRKIEPPLGDDAADNLKSVVIERYGNEHMHIGRGQD